MTKHVVVLSAFASPLRSGAEACAEEVAAELADRYRFTIVTARMRRDLPKKDVLPDGTPVIRIGVGMTVDKWLYPFLAPLAARRLRPDMLHGILETFAGLALWFCRWILPGVSRLLTCQTTNRAFLKGMIVRAPHRVTVISQSLKKQVVQLGREQVTLIPNGIRVAKFRQAAKREQRVPGRILFVGRLEPMKGIDTLLQAFAQLQTSHPQATLRIVGAGSQRTVLERRVQQLQISERVRFAGAVEPEAIPLEYAQAEIFCGLSRSEALGNVFLEAQAAGCAVVATTIGGIPDIVHDGETGLLVPPDDALAAAQALTLLLDTSERRILFGQAGQTLAAQYDWQAIAAQYEAEYRHVLS